MHNCNAKMYYIYPQNKHFYNIKTYDLYFLSGISSHARFCSMDSVRGVSDKYQVGFQLCSLLKCLPLCVATQCHSHKCSEIWSVMKVSSHGQTNSWSLGGKGSKSTFLSASNGFQSNLKVLSSDTILFRVSIFFNLSIFSSFFRDSFCLKDHTQWTVTTILNIKCFRILKVQTISTDVRMREVRTN